MKEVIFISKEYINPFTEYGKKVQFRLIELGKKQSWLIEEVKKETNMFFDSSRLNKVLTGQTNSPKITEAISKILNIKEV